MQAEISSAGGATTTTPKTTVVTNNLSSQPEIVARPITPDNRDVQSASTSVIVASPDQSVVSFSRRREPSEAETMVTTDAVALPLESTANLRHRACSTDKQTLGAAAGAGVGVASKSASAAWQPFPLAELTTRRRNLSDSEKKKLKKGTIEYYRKQSRWVDELIEVDRLLRTTPTTTKPPPLPSGSVALATTTELETLLEGDAGGTGGEAARLAFASGSGSEPGPGLGPERSSGDLGADPDGGRERSPTTHTASVEVLSIAASAPANGDVGGVKSAEENGPAVVVPIGLPSTATATATSAETKLDVDMTASNGLNGGAVSALGGAGAGGAGAPRGDDEPADVEKGAKTVEQMQREADHRNIIATRVAKVLLCVNLVLIGFKLAAVILSGSLAVVAVLVDNAVDLASGVVIWVSNVAVRKRNVHKYPQGRKRLEPVGIVILSAIMAVASAQVIMESVTKLYEMIRSPEVPGPMMGWVPIGLLITDFVTKTTLFIVFFRFRKGNPSIQTVQLDLRNDMVSNVASLGSGLVATYLFKYVDPAVAILIALYIAFNWGRQLIVQARMLTGYTAPKEFLNTVTWIAVSHDPRIVQLETVRAFHAGLEYFVEVDIVLPTDMSVREAHDIGESLQQKLELMQNVARAFVHVDHESYHNPEIEHKLG